MNSYYERVGEHRFRPGAAAGGAWAPDEQHIAPLTGLIVHEIERVAAGRGGGALVTSRISVDILGRLPMEEFEVRVETLRPGRTIELLEAVVTAGGRPTVRARVWRLAGYDSGAVAGGEAGPLPGPETLPTTAPPPIWRSDFLDTLDIRYAGEPAPGRGAAWITSPLSLVAGEPASAVAEFVKVVDPANGIMVRASPAEWMFPNVDLTIHLHRTPAGPWTGLDVDVVLGPSGHGVTSTVLHDLHGPVGRAEQMLTVRPR